MLYHPLSVTTFLTCNKYVPDMTILEFHFKSVSLGVLLLLIIINYLLSARHIGVGISNIHSNLVGVGIIVVVVVIVVIIIIVVVVHTVHS